MIINSIVLIQAWSGSFVRLVTCTYLPDSPGSVPEKIKPLSFPSFTQIHDVCGQIIHGHPEDWHRAELMGQWLFLNTKKRLCKRRLTSMQAAVEEYCTVTAKI